MECPHCGGPIDVRELKPFEHAVFDDRWRQIVLGEERRDLQPQSWRLLRLLRTRFRRFVPADYLAQWSAVNPADGGHVPSLRVEIHRLRRALDSTPFAIASQHAWGYGLFPLDEVRIATAPNGARHTRAKPREAAATTVQEWAQDEPGIARAPRRARRRPRS